MKKLLIAMTAAAVGTCAWAEGEQTLLNETFESNWTLTDNTWWTYSAGEAADGELTLADGKLSLNTGSKKLTGNFVSNGSSTNIANGLYFNATVTFKDPSDTLPELTDADKFALVVLDNVESIDAEKATAPATNLMVIAKYGDGAQRAYELDVTVDSDWLDDEHEIVVKAYDNVMKSGSTACAGFLVMVDEIVCKVVKSYAIVDGVVDFGVFCAGNNFEDDGLGGAGQLGYLGYVKDAIDASVQQRYQNAELLLSNVPSSATLTSVDFQGQGVIDDVSLATTGADFGADATVLTFAGYDATKIASITVAGKTVTGGAYTILGNEDKDADNKSTITVTVQEGYVLDMTGWTKNGLTYTYLYELPTTSAAITLNVFAPAAYVGDKAYKTFSLALTDALKDGGTLKLSGDVTAADFGSYTYLYVQLGESLVLDLNGNTIQGSGTTELPTPSIFNEGILTIKDSVGTGCVKSSGYGAVLNTGTLAIEAGIFDGAVTTDGGTTTITGGKFLKEANATITTATGYAATDDGTYWVVAPASNYPESDKLVDSSDVTLSEDDKKAIKDTFDAIAGAATDKDAAVTNYINTVYGATVPADALIGAKSVDISVKFNLPLMKTETPTIEVAPATVTADSGNAAAFEFTIKDDGTALTLSQVAKVLEMVEYVADLANDWAAATAADVDTSVNAGKAKVELKAKTGVNKGFIRLKLR